MRHVRVALGLHEALDPHRARHADAREVVAAEVDEHRVLRAVLLRREQRRRVALAGRDRPGDRVQLGAAARALDDRLGRAAHEREVAELEEEEVRRRVDAAQRPVELDRRRRRRAGRALRDHDLEDVALADVLLRALDAAEVLLARRLALERTARRRAAGQGRRRPGEPGRVAAQQLGDAARVVEAQQDVGDEEEALRHAGPVVRQRHRRLERRDRVVAEVADDRLAERLRLLERDEPGAGADEAVAPEPAALDRLEQERAARALAQREVRAERRQEVGWDLGFGHEKGPSRSRVERDGLYWRDSACAQAPATLGAPDPPVADGSHGRRVGQALRERQAAKTWPASSSASAARPRSAERTRT